MTIRKSAVLMSDDAAATDAGDAGWASSDASGWWQIANVGFDLGSDELGSDMRPHPAESPPITVEDPLTGRIVQAPPPEPDPSLERPSSNLPDPSSDNSDNPPTSDAGPPPDRGGDVPPSGPADSSDRPVVGSPAPPQVDANDRPTSDAGRIADLVQEMVRELMQPPSPPGLGHNTIYFRPDAPPADSDDTAPSRGGDPRVDVVDHGNADPNPRDVLLAAISDDLHLMLAGAWHL